MRDFITLAEAVLYSGRADVQYRDQEITLWEDPSRAEFRQALANSRYGSLRGLYDTGLIIWDSDDGTHYDIVDWISRKMSTAIEGDSLEFDANSIEVKMYEDGLGDEQIEALIRERFSKYYPGDFRVVIRRDDW